MVSVAPNGDIWVGSSNRMIIFDASGKFKNNHPNLSGNQFNTVAFDAEGNPVVGVNVGQLMWFNGDKVLSGGEFASHSPWEVVIEDGFAYATDSGNKVLKKIRRGSESLAVTQVYKAPDDAPIIRPISVALDKAKRLYATDEARTGLWIWNNDGTFVKKILPDTKLGRVRRGADGNIYANANDRVLVIDPATLTTQREIPVPAPARSAMGFAIDAQGNFLFSGFYSGLVIKTDAQGKQLAVIGPSYQATLAAPDSLAPGQSVNLNLKVVPIATNIAGKMPQFSAALQPAVLAGEPDSNFANSQGAVTAAKSQAEWWEKRQKLYAAQEQKLDVAQSENALQVRVPEGVASNLYNLVIRADNGIAPETDNGTRAVEQPIGVTREGDANSLTLFIPRGRSVFQQGERIEINVILRARSTLPAGSLKFSLTPRGGESLEINAKAPLWREFPVAAGGTQTLTFRADANGIHPGRYLLQTEYSANGKTLRDVWPLQIVPVDQESRFRVLFPEWGAGYTDNWGTFTGNGMREDAAALASRGIMLYDTAVVERSQSPALNPFGPEAARASSLASIAATNSALPASERFLAASPLEIQLQEMLRYNIQVHQDIWGSHELANWGYANPQSISMDNRRVQLWTQWQREWPSWIGHRYLSLSLDEERGPERIALKEQLKTKGLTPPTADELKWARNGASWPSMRRFITDAPQPVDTTLTSVAVAPDGTVYIGSISGVLLKYSPEGKLLSTLKVQGNLSDLAVAKDGTIYGAGDGYLLKVATDGKITHWPATGFDKYAPRSVAIEPGGTLLFTDAANKRVRRFSTEGKHLADIGSADSLKSPSSVSVANDGSIYVMDEGSGGVTIFDADGKVTNFLPRISGHVPGGKVDICCAPDDTFWVNGWGASGVTRNIDKDGKEIRRVGRITFAPGGFGLPMSVALRPNGNLMIADVTLPYIQEMTPDDKPVRFWGLGKFLADVRLDRQRYTYSDRIIASVWKPIAGQEGPKDYTLQAFAQAAEATDKNAWVRLEVEASGGRDYIITTPELTGKVVLRLVWSTPGADANNPLRTDFNIEMSTQVSPEDAQKAKDIVDRQLAYRTAFAKSRMGALVRWTKLSDRVATSGGHVPTQNIAPTNYGTPDTSDHGVWVPWRREAVMVEAENEGHDYGSYPLHGPWYLARALEGPAPRPVWGSLLQEYWRKPEHFPRPRRDHVMLLGAGASGIGTGKLPLAMNAEQKAMHQELVAFWQRFGDVSVALDIPGQNGVAVLHSFVQENMDVLNEEHFYAAHAAWYDLLRAHIPVGVVTEESIAQGGLEKRFKAVLLPYIHHPLPEATMKALAKFQESGGEVWVDLGTRINVPGAKVLKTRYRPFWIQDAYYWIHNGYGPGAYDGNYEYRSTKEGSNSRLPAVKTAFGKWAQMPVTTSDPDVFLMERKGGQATYIFAGNDHYPDKPLHETHLAFETPAPATAPFTLSGGAVYDVMAQKLVTEKTLNVAFTDKEPSRIWAVLPRPMAKLSVRANSDGEYFYVTTQVLDASDKPLAATIPLEVIISDSSGKEQYRRRRSTEANGFCRLKVPVAWLAPTGAWKVTARETLTGKLSATATANVAARGAAEIAQDKSAALVFDREQIGSWLKSKEGKEVWIALDKDQSTLRGEADKIAQVLNALGISAKVINISDVPEMPLTLEHSMSDEQKATLEKVRAGQAVGVRQNTPAFRSPGPTRAIMRDLVLLGQPSQNRWLKDIHDQQLVRRPLTPNYPGTGRALIQYSWTPFYDGFDALLIGATDSAGLQAGITEISKLKPE